MSATRYISEISRLNEVHMTFGEKIGVAKHIITALMVGGAAILYSCGGQPPNKSDPYGEMARGLRDKGAHKKGTGFND